MPGQRGWILLLLTVLVIINCVVKKRQSYQKHVLFAVVCVCVHKGAI